MLENTKGRQTMPNKLRVTLYLIIFPFDPACLLNKNLLSPGILKLMFLVLRYVTFHQTIY